MDGSLYIKAMNKSLPAHQRIDAGTVEWIKSQGPELNFCVNLVDKGSIGDVSNFIRSMTEAWDFVRELPFGDHVYSRGGLARDTIHGDLHAYRVAILAYCLNRANSRKLSAIAGLYHDIARINDKSDEGHGERSAERLVKLGLLQRMGLSPVERTKIILAIKLHEDILDHKQRQDPVIVSLKTADALDRYRLPKLKWWPNKEYMDSLPEEFVFCIAFKQVLYSEAEYLMTKDSSKAIASTLEKLSQGI